MASPSSSPTPQHLDTITLRNLRTHAIVGLDAWSRPSKPQPVVLSLSLGVDTEPAGRSDDVADTVNYGGVCKEVLAAVEGRSFGGIEGLVDKVVEVGGGWRGESLEVRARAGEGLLRCEGGLERWVVLRRGRGGRQGWWVGGLKVACVVGVNAHEREEKQTVVVELGVEGTEEELARWTAVCRKEGDEGMGGRVWRDMVRRVCGVVETSAFRTLEALAAGVARTALEGGVVPRVEVRVEKPSALAAVEGAGVRIVRERGWLKEREGW